MKTKTFKNTKLLSIILCAMLFINCEKDEIKYDSSTIETSAYYSRIHPELDIKGVRKDIRNSLNDLIGSYKYIQWVSEKPQDLNNDGISNKNLLFEMKDCNRDNTIEFNTNSYNLFDTGITCNENIKEGAKLFNAKMFYNYSDTADYSTIILYDENENVKSILSGVEIYYDYLTNTNTLLALYEENYPQEKYDFLILQE